MAGYAIKSAADFEKSMSAVSAATHASTGDIEKLRKAALQAGKDTQYSATEAADGITELSKAGVTTADVLNGGLKGALSLAAAGQISVGEAAETAASAMTQFKLKGDKIPHVADLLAAGAGKAQGSVHDMSMALNQSGLVAAQFGLSIEDTTGALAEFASAGLLGSDAGTSLKTMLLAIANPSSVSAKLMQQLGISFYDAQGKFIGLGGTAEVLRRRLGDLTDQQRQQTLGQIFGSDAIRAASILYRDGAKGVDEWRGKVNEAGYAAETAGKLTDNLAGDIERLKGSLETMAIESGGGANGGLRILVKTLEGLVNEFGQLPHVVSSGITILAGVTGAALLLGAGWVKTRKSTAAFRAELAAIGPAGEKASAGLGRVSSAAGKIGVVFAALEVAGAIISTFQKDLKPQLDGLSVGLSKFAESGKTAGEASRVLGEDMKDLKSTFDLIADEDNKRKAAAKGLQGALESIVPGLAGTNTSLAKTQERITAVDATLAQLVSSGNIDQAKTDFNALARQLATGGVSLEEFKKQFPQYAAAVEAAGSSSAKTASQTGDLNSALALGEGVQKKYTSAAEAAAAAAKGEESALSQLADFMKAQINPVFALADAEKNLTEAQKAASKAIREHGKDSKEAKEATQKLALAAVELQSSAGALGATFNGKLSPAMLATFRAAGITAPQIKILEKQFKDAKKAADSYDGKYEAKASAPGATQAKKDLDHAYTSANKFAGPYKATVTVYGVDPAELKLRRLSIYQQALKSGKIPVGFNGPIKGPDGKYYADGGWTGPGSKWDPAGVVHADEFVIKKDSRRKIEAQAPGMLAEMNATGQAPGYAGGGRVSSLPYRTTAAMTKIPSKASVTSAVAGNFGNWPSSPGAQRGDSGVWRKIVALVKASGIPYQFGNAYRPGDPLWHGSGRAVDFMGYNQDRLAQFFMARENQVLELIHRTKSRDYGVTRGHYNAMPTQWPLHRNHLHVAMKNGGTINEPITGVGASGRTYSFGENWQGERLNVAPNWQPAGGGGGTNVTVVLENHGVIGSRTEVDDWLTGAVDRLRSRGRV
jgi:TP901 family phage tail tape measure protein